MEFNNTMTVRELAVGMPHSTRVLEQLKIDYCCGGSLSFQEACSVAGVEAADVLRQINELERHIAGTNSADDSFRTMPLDELTEHIVSTHHIFTRSELERLSSLAEKVYAAHQSNHPELQRIKYLLEELGADLNPHMQKEEQILFPFIDRLQAASKSAGMVVPPAFGTVLNPVRMMMFEHDRAGALLQDIRSASSNFVVPPDGCTSYQMLYQGLEGLERDLHQHIHLENNILFPRAVEMERMIQSR